MIFPLIFLFAMQVDPVVPLTIDVGRDSTNSFAFDWSGTHEDGSAGAEVTEAEFQFTPLTGQQLRVRVPHVGVAGENRVAVKDALLNVPAGVYDLQLRLLDPGGQPSTYSPILSIRVRVKNPSAPQNVRVVGD
jgi:hypothetical protein